MSCSYSRQASLFNFAKHSWLLALSNLSSVLSHISSVLLIISSLVILGLPPQRTPLRRCFNRKLFATSLSSADFSCMRSDTLRTFISNRMFAVISANTTAFYVFGITSAKTFKFTIFAFHFNSTPSLSQFLLSMLPSKHLVYRFYLLVLLKCRRLHFPVPLNDV